MPILTKQFIDTLPPTNRIQVFYWDLEPKGFGLKVMGSGARMFVLQYRTLDGDIRRIVIGDYLEVTIEQARHRAKEMLREIAQGKDPLEEKRARRNAPTMEMMIEHYMEKHARIKKKASSVKLDESLITRFILPAFAGRRIKDINRADINKLHYDMRGTPVSANHVRQILSKMFNLAEKWGWRPDHTNPVRHVDPYPMKKRERYLNLEELIKLQYILDGEERHGTAEPQVVAAFRLLIFTGCRHGEIQTLKWEHVDFEHRCLRLPDSKTGAKNVQLGEPALEVLRRLPRLPDNPYVIYGTLPGKYWADLQGVWERIRIKANIVDVRIHDLRHTFASIAVGMGVSLPMIGKLLGHSQIQTTERYAHVAVAPQQEAADRIASTIASMMTSGPKLLTGPFSA